MKNITIPESEYLKLIQSIQELKTEVERLKVRFLPVEKKHKKPPSGSGSSFARLRGVVTLPNGFDHKDFLGDELLSAYFSK